MYEGNLLQFVRDEKHGNSYHVKNEKERSIGDIKLIENDGARECRFFPAGNLDNGLSTLALREISGFGLGLLAGHEMPERATAHV